MPASTMPATGSRARIMKGHFAGEFGTVASRPQDHPVTAAAVAAQIEPPSRPVPATCDGFVFAILDCYPDLGPVGFPPAEVDVFPAMTAAERARYAGLICGAIRSRKAVGDIPPGAGGFYEAAAFVPGVNFLGLAGVPEHTSDDDLDALFEEINRRMAWDMTGITPAEFEMLADLAAVRAAWEVNTAQEDQPTVPLAERLAEILKTGYTPAERGRP